MPSVQLDEFLRERPEVNPTIYAYTIPEVEKLRGYIKVGFTDRNVEARIKEQLHTAGLEGKILFKESAMCADGSCFTDKQVHKILERRGFTRLNQGKDRNEWFFCKEEDVLAAIKELRTGKRIDEDRNETFEMRPEQERAVEITSAYFKATLKEKPESSPKFLWNAKMRFGKTFAAYKLAQSMKLKRILVLTFKPAVESAWADDLYHHVDFKGWQFISNKDARDINFSIDEEFEEADKNKPIVVFGSFQDLLGRNDAGGIKAKNEFIHSEKWDLVIFDEYHFGAWRENAKNLFEKQDEEAEVNFDQEEFQRKEAANAMDESFLPITTKYYLYLSGTPFRALNSGEFIEEQIFNWTYSDEQRAKETWIGKNNPYKALPRMVLMTYKIPESIREVASQGEFDEFDLNEFFKAEGKGENAKFKHENEVQKWLDLIRGSYLPSSVDDLKLGQDKRPPMPYSDTRLLNILTHTLWFLPDVAACDAMKNLIDQRQNTFYHDYKVIVCAGTKAGIGLEALKPVQAAMANPLNSKTITLSCGKLTTGVTVRPWTGVFMLRNLKSPETYFQTAFRVQSPWEIKDDKGNPQIIKENCYVFDFALDRALKQISSYSSRLDINESDPEKRVAEFTKFLPVLAYDGSAMMQLNAEAILDIAMSGTSATLLARRWESALLVNVDNDTLKRLMDNPDAMEALMRIEGFRSLNSDIIKFATRVPVFMYLTDYRERCLKDVITQLEPGLFKKVTGLEVKDFELLCSLNVFNASLMNEAIFSFKRYEDSSLSYTGLDLHAGDDVGGFDTVLRRREYEELFYGQQRSMMSVEHGEDYVEGDNVSPEVAMAAEKQALYSRIKAGSVVTHKQLGKGVVDRISKDRRYIHVKFGKTEKMFVFYDTFKKGLLK